MRLPQNAVRLVGRAGGALSPGKTYKLMRALRKHAPNYLDQWWMLASERRHAKDTTAQMAELKADWSRVKKLLGKSHGKAGSLTPGWIVVQRRPTYVITRQLPAARASPQRGRPHQQTATAMPMLPSRPPWWVCGGDTDARHLPISASSINRKQSKKTAR